MLPETSSFLWIGISSRNINQKIFKKNNIKLNYRWIRNLEQYIAQHNSVDLNIYFSNANNKTAMMIKNAISVKRPCVLWMVNVCIKRLTIKPASGIMTKLILLWVNFKQLEKNYFLSSLNIKKKYANATALSMFYWVMKRDRYTHAVNCELVAKINPFSGRGDRCNQSLLEKNSSGKILIIYTFFISGMCLFLLENKEKVFS